MTPPSGFGTWAPGTGAAQSFREDVHRLILWPAKISTDALDSDASRRWNEATEAYQDGRASEDQFEIAIRDSIDCSEQAAYVRRWAHVMLTTRLLDALNDMLRTLAAANGHGRLKRKKMESEWDAYRREFLRYSIQHTTENTIRLGSMNTARNLIIHNSGLLRRAPPSIRESPLEGGLKPRKETPPELVNYDGGSGLVVVSQQLLRENIDWALDLIDSLGAEVDRAIERSTSG